MNAIIKDEKAQTILELLADGKSREEISHHFEQDWKTLYIYMNRRDFRWDKDSETFMKKNEAEEKDQQCVQTVNTKAAQVIRLLDVKHPNIQQVAGKQGFATMEELGAYMKAQGYMWDDDAQNYVENSSLLESKDERIPSEIMKEGMMDEKSLLRFLVQHQDRLVQFLSDTGELSVPTYKFKGNKANKTLTLASSAVALLEDFHKENNLTQRAVVEAALAEFFIRHGYKDKMSAMML